MNVLPQMTYPLGAVIRIDAAFTRPATPDELFDPTVITDGNGEVAADPASVKFRTKAPDGTLVDYVFGVALELVKLSTGVYMANLPNAANLAGQWFYRIEGTGDGQAAGEASYKVAASEFAP